MVGLLNVKLCESNNLFVGNSICRCFHAVKSCALGGPPPVSSPTHMRIYHHHHCTLNTIIVLFYLNLIWSTTPQAPRRNQLKNERLGSQGFCRLLLSGGINFAWISLILTSGFWNLCSWIFVSRKMCYSINGSTSYSALDHHHLA